MEKIIGNYFAPEAEVQQGYSGLVWETVSVGVCKVLPKSNGQPKLGPAAVRITGPNTEEGVAAINRLAETVAGQLKDGTYGGPKHLKTDSPYAKAQENQGTVIPAPSID